MPKSKSPRTRAVLFNRLRRHLRKDPSALRVLEQEFATYERANLHLALEVLLARVRELVAVGPSPAVP